MNAFPAALGLTARHLEEVVRMAGAAPSLHNSQPWRFRVLPDVIELHADPARALPATDPGGRELRVSCGAALLNMRSSVEHFGVLPMVTLMPRAAEPEALAEVRQGGALRSESELARLFRVIRQRRTNRRPFLDTPVPDRHRHALEAAVRAEGCWLHAVRNSERRPLEELMRRAHREQTADPEFRAEWSQWTGLQEGAAVGVPASAAGPEPEPQDLWVMRDFSGGSARTRVAGKDFESTPYLVVLCSYNEDQYDDLLAGQALQRLLLTATARGLAVSPLSHVVEVAQTRGELRQMLGGTLHPQSVLRVGYGSPTPPVPRQPAGGLIAGDP